MAPLLLGGIQVMGVTAALFLPSCPLASLKSSQPPMVSLALKVMALSLPGDLQPVVVTVALWRAS